MPEGKFLSCVKFQGFCIQELVLCTMPHIFFYAVNSVLRIGCSKETGQKRVFSKIFLGFRVCAGGSVRFGRRLVAAVGIRKSSAEGKLKVAAPVEKNPRKWFQRRK